MPENYERNSLDDKEVCVQLEAIKNRQLLILCDKAKSEKVKLWLSALMSLIDDILYFYKSP